MPEPTRCRCTVFSAVLLILALTVEGVAAQQTQPTLTLRDLFEDTEPVARTTSEELVRRLVGSLGVEPCIGPTCDPADVVTVSVDVGEGVSIGTDPGSVIELAKSLARDPEEVLNEFFEFISGVTTYVITAPVRIVCAPYNFLAWLTGSNRRCYATPMEYDRALGEQRAQAAEQQREQLRQICTIDAKTSDQLLRTEPVSRMNGLGGEFRRLLDRGGRTWHQQETSLGGDVEWHDGGLHQMPDQARQYPLAIDGKSVISAPGSWTPVKGTYPLIDHLAWTLLVTIPRSVLDNRPPVPILRRGDDDPGALQGGTIFGDRATGFSMSYVGDRFDGVTRTFGGSSEFPLPEESGCSQPEGQEFRCAIEPSRYDEARRIARGTLGLFVFSGPEFLINELGQEVRQLDDVRMYLMVSSMRDLLSTDEADSSKVIAWAVLVYQGEFTAVPLNPLRTSKVAVSACDPLQGWNTAELLSDQQYRLDETRHKVVTLATLAWADTVEGTDEKPEGGFVVMKTTWRDGTESIRAEMVRPSGTAEQEVAWRSYMYGAHANGHGVTEGLHEGARGAYTEFGWIGPERGHQVRTTLAWDANRNVYEADVEVPVFDGFLVDDALESFRVITNLAARGR